MKKIIDNALCSFLGAALAIVLLGTTLLQLLIWVGK